MPIVARRVFIGIPTYEGLEKEFPDLLKKAKVSASRHELDVKWSPVTNYHLTLAYLGDTPDDKIPLLQKNCEELAVKISPFELEIYDVGAFPDERSGRVIWLGVKNTRSFVELSNAVKTAVLPLGHQPSEEEFTPHITVGRLRNPARLTDVISPLKRKAFGTVEVSKIVLYESHLQGYFPVYKPLSEVALQRRDPQ